MSINLLNVWVNNNPLKHSSNHQQHTIKVDCVLSNLEEFHKTRNAIVTQISSISGVVVEKWSKLLEEQFRLDVDAVFKDQNVKYIVRTKNKYKEAILCFSALRIRKSGLVLSVELLAIQHGLLLATQDDLANVWVFSDSFRLFKRLNLLQMFSTMKNQLLAIF